MPKPGVYGLGCSGQQQPGRIGGWWFTGWVDWGGCRALPFGSREGPAYAAGMLQVRARGLIGNRLLGMCWVGVDHKNAGATARPAP